MLVDFAGAGRSRNKYASWLVVNFNDQACEEITKDKIWQTRLSHDIIVNEAYLTIVDTKNIAAGTVVNVLVRGGKEPIIYTVNGDVQLTKINDTTYQFVMPGCDVYLDIK